MCEKFLSTVAQQQQQQQQQKNTPYYFAAKLSQKNSNGIIRPKIMSTF